jgi:hypothetical protein
VKQIIALILNEFILNRQRRERFTVDSSKYKPNRWRESLSTDNDERSRAVGLTADPSQSFREVIGLVDALMAERERQAAARQNPAPGAADYLYLTRESELQESNGRLGSSLSAGPTNVCQKTFRIGQ